MAAGRIAQQDSFLLHAHPWRETSLVLDLFSREHGRVALVAKGARRPTSQWRGVLMAFQPLWASWSGKGEVKTLTDVEWQGGQALLTGSALLCGYYANELLTRLLPREDGHPGLFDAYRSLLGALASAERQDPALRGFELALLAELGYAPSFDQDLDGDAVQPDGRYVFIIEQGPAKAQAHLGLPAFDGQTLLDLARRDLSRPATLAQAKGLMRRLIAHLMGGLPLESRRIFMELQEL